MLELLPKFILALGMMGFALWIVAPLALRHFPEACGPEPVRPEDVRIVCTICHQVYAGNWEGSVAFHGICDHCWGDFLPPNLNEAPGGECPASVDTTAEAVLQPTLKS